MAQQEVVQILVALGIGGGVVEGARALFSRRKMSADYADVISASAVRLLTALEKRVDGLEEDLERERSERQEERGRLEAKISLLEGTILSLGGTLPA